MPFLYVKVIKPCVVWEYGLVPIRFIASATKLNNKRESPNIRKRRQPKHQYPSNFGLGSKEKKALKKKLLLNEKETANDHAFKELYPWKTKLELAQHLRNTEVYNNDGLIALCKPYGIAQVPVNPDGDGSSRTVIQTLNSGGIPDNVPTIRDTLPLLKELYGVPHLEVIKSTERWSSGLILLCTNKELTEKVQKCFRRSASFEQPALTYWAVTVGLPKPATIATKVGSTLEYVSNAGKVPVILKNYSNASVKKGVVRLSLVEHNALIFNKETGASLVEVNVQGVHWHFLRVWLSYSYSPILGDALYSARVKTVAGRRLKISPHNLTSYEPQVIPEPLFSKLELQPTAVEMIPCHLHLAKVRLSGFQKDKSDLIISAPPPSHFVWTCRQLGLMADKDDYTSEAETKTTLQKENEG